jgi:hypothetical protein
VPGKRPRFFDHGWVVAPPNHIFLADLADFGGLDDLASTEAAGANVDPLGGTVHQGSNALNVWIPTTLGAHVGVANTHAERRLLAANFANRCHVESFVIVNRT